METRQLGGTDMRVGVLGFGGAEIGFERAESESPSLKWRLVPSCPK